MKDTGFFANVKENSLYALTFLGIIVALFVAAYLFDLWARKRTGSGRKLFTTRNIALIGIFAAFAFVLHILDFPLPFAPSFYKLDFSEIPVMIGAFSMGPAAGVIIEFIKILLKLLVKGTTTAFVGDLANFVVGCSLILPAAIIYDFRKTRKTALLSCIVGTVVITVFGSLFNALYLLPAFSKLYGMPMDSIIGMGTAINKNITDVKSLVFFAVAPLNLVKGLAVSIVTMLVYKPLKNALKKAKLVKE